MTVGEVPEGAAFRLIRCARNYGLPPVALARTFRTLAKPHPYERLRFCAAADGYDYALCKDRPVVLVDVRQTLGGWGRR